MSDPSLHGETRERLVHQLMQARRDVKMAASLTELRQARASVELNKRALGERGPVWWLDGACDFNQYLVASTPYAIWYASVVKKL